MSKRDSVYKVSFVQNKSIYEIYARYVSDETLMGFVELEELLFSDPTSIVLDPSEEKLKSEFIGVKRTYIPMHTILRIDEVRQKGVAKIRNQESGAGNISHFPGAHLIKKAPIIKDQE